MYLKYKDAPDTGKASHPEDLRISGGLPVHMQRKCRDTYNETRRILLASKIPKAKRVLNGSVRFMKPARNTNVRTLGTFYAHKDMINIKALEREGGALLGTLIHECGHRYNANFIDNAVQMEWLAYNKMLISDRKYWEGKEVTLAAKLGWSVSSMQTHAFTKGVIVEMGKGRNGTIKVQKKDGSIKEIKRWELDSIYRRTAPQFPTEYSRKNPEEHFAETWAGYHLGRLSPELVSHFEHLLIDKQPASTLKIASSHTAEGGEIEVLEEGEEGKWDIDAPEDDIITSSDLMKALTQANILGEAIEFNGAKHSIHGLNLLDFDEAEEIILSLLPDAFVAHNEDTLEVVIETTRTASIWPSF